MTLEERLEHDTKEAMKAGDRLRTEALRFIRAALHNRAIELKKKTMEDGEALPVLMTLAKQREESIAMFSKSNRKDLVDKETKELAILKSYLPPAASNEEILKAIDAALSEVGANMGPIMKKVTPQFAGRADGKIISQLVKDRLQAK